MRRAASALACLAVAATPAVANAETVAPQPDSPCGAAVADALTRMPDSSTVLQCRGGRWQPFDDPFPHGDRWFSYGPTLTLHGAAQRNREIDSGDWTATPQHPGTRCAATQTAIADTGSLGPPQVSRAEPGRPLTVRLLPLLFTVDLSGECLWVRR